MPRQWVNAIMLGTRTQSEGGTDRPGDGLNLTDAYDVLRNDRRRYALAVIERHGTVPKGELVDAVAANEGATTTEGRKRVYVALQQAHLPKLEDMGAIEERDGGLSLTPRGEAVWAIHEAGSEANELRNGVRGRVASVLF